MFYCRCPRRARTTFLVRIPRAQGIAPQRRDLRRASMRFSSRPTTSIVPFDSLSLGIRRPADEVISGGHGVANVNDRRRGQPVVNDECRFLDVLAWRRPWASRAHAFSFFDDVS